jgi:hypothetical protein
MLKLHLLQHLAVPNSKSETQKLIRDILEEPQHSRPATSDLNDKLEKRKPVSHALTKRRGK